tara:strand:+ start:1613 stop:1849 length:237 start_codon:yes stop_codon:yes gene_type:complete
MAVPKDTLEAFYQAWYDTKMDPTNPEVRADYLDALDELQAAMGGGFQAHEIKEALGESFSTWQKHERLPKPPRKPTQD